MKLIIKSLLISLLISLSQSSNLNKYSVSKSAENQDRTKSPFNADSAISLAKEIATLIVNNPTPTPDNTLQSKISACFGQLSKKKSTLTSNLSSFWTDMNKLSINQNPSGNYDTNSFVNNIAIPLSKSSVSVDNQNVNCNTLLSNVKPVGQPDIIKILKKPDYFGFFKLNGNPAEKGFLTGIVGTRRHLLPKTAFYVLNGVPAPNSK